MRIAVIQFPGANCERETCLALIRAGMTPHEFLWNEPRERLDEFQGYVIVGGFSYEDRGRAGVIAALDPLMQVLKAQSHAGKPILGICNGAQILVESGLVPGLENDQCGMALTDNKRMQQGQLVGTGYYNAWIHMRLSDNYQLNAFTRHLTSKNILQLPIAHAEGRFVIPPALLIEMENNGQLLFQYCDATGQIIDEFPINPNGSIKNIAAVSNKAGNVLAMMPHPERTIDCDAIFLSMKDYIESGYVQKVLPLYYQPRVDRPLEYHLPQPALELIVELLIIDQHAISVENALHHANIPTSIRRFIHWEIECDSEETFEKIKKSGVLYNNRKEKIVNPQGIKSQGCKTFLVRHKENLQGLEKLQMLTHHFNLPGIKSIKQGILWQLPSDDLKEDIIHSNILWNPYAHDYYDY